MADGENDSGGRVDPHDELIKLRTEFEQSTTPLQRLIARIRCHLGSPGMVFLVGGAALAWVLVNTAYGRRAFDPAPFNTLETFATVAALLATILILAGRRREDEAARRISRLTLHMAVESEQKIAKLIGLMEEQRRDSAAIPDRHDPEAEQMASPSGPREVLERLEADDLH